jgi:hypothetical protein
MVRGGASPNGRFGTFRSTGLGREGKIVVGLRRGHLGRLSARQRQDWRSDPGIVVADKILSQFWHICRVASEPPRQPANQRPCSMRNAKNVSVVRSACGSVPRRRQQTRAPGPARDVAITARRRPHAHGRSFRNQKTGSWTTMSTATVSRSRLSEKLLGKLEPHFWRLSRGHKSRDEMVRKPHLSRPPLAKARATRGSSQKTSSRGGGPDLLAADEVRVGRCFSNSSGKTRFSGYCGLQGVGRVHAGGCWCHFPGSRE